MALTAGTKLYFQGKPHLMIVGIDEYGWYGLILLNDEEQNVIRVPAIQVHQHIKDNHWTINSKQQIGTRGTGGWVIKQIK